MGSAPDTSTASDRDSEPLLRPRALRGPTLSVVRTARLFRRGNALVLRRRSRRERSLSIGGADGVQSAVYVAGETSSDGSASAAASPADCLELRDAQRQVLAYFRLADWLPEAARLGWNHSMTRSDLLKRSGVTDLLRSAGIPLDIAKPSTSDGNARPVRRIRNTWDAKHWSPGPFFPTWYTAIRLSGLLVWFALFTVMLFGAFTTPWIVLTSALAVLSVPLARLALRGESALRSRSTRPTYLFTLGPCPAPKEEATVRFVGHSSVHVTEDDLVLRDFTGREEWLPRYGPHAVSKLVRVLGASPSRQPLGIEFVGPDGQIREKLPWAWWFGGQGGTANWRDLQRATGMTATDRRLASKKSTWTDHHTNPGDAGQLLMAPPRTAREARKAVAFPHAVMGASPAFVVVAAVATLQQTFGDRGKFSSVPMLDGHPAVKTAVLICVLSAVTLLVIPSAWRLALSRLKLDRPSTGRRKTGR